jgi:diacylglycerol O-acyltransferase / wax synthase
MLRQLSSQDASFLYQDSPSTPMHVGSVAILDPTKSPYGALTLERMLQFYRERLHLMPTARRRLVNVPFGLDHPYWIEDENFDLEYHIREVGLPEPHDWAQFYTLAARILSRPLDLTRAPWETYLVHGLDRLDNVPSGCVGLLTKMHHCAIDGQSGMEMAMAMADLTPEVAPVKPPKEPWQSDRPPSNLELMMRTYSNNLLRPIQIAELATQSMRVQQNLTENFRRQIPAQPRPIPKTRFNAAVTPHRVIGFKRFVLDEVRAMKNGVADATVNDVVLAICGGALRAYLLAKQELPADPLVAMAPISTRKNKSDYSMGNQVSAMFIAIGTDIPDPKARLLTIRTLTRNAKEMTNSIGASLMTRYGEFIPAGTQNLAARLTAEYARGSQAAVPFNCSITNVPGPQVPLYTMGCETVTTVGYGPIVHNMGLIIPVSSYYGELSISFTSCRDMIPDPEFFMQCIQDGYDEMKEALLGRDADAKVAAVSKNYEQLAEKALDEVRAARVRAESSA